MTLPGRPERPHLASMNTTRPSRSTGSPARALLPPPIGAVLLAAALACAPPDPAADEPATTQPGQAAPPQDAAAVASFTCEDLAWTILPVNATRAGLEGRFGAPDSVSVRTVPNRHVAGETDSLFTVQYPGLVAGIHTAGGRDLPAHVVVDDDRFLRAGAPGPGDTGAAVVAALGEPTRRTATALVYECGPEVEEPVTFHLRDGVVQRVEIGYYVD